MKKKKNHMQTIKENVWGSICVAILCAAAIVVSVLLMNRSDGETAPTEPEDSPPAVMEPEPTEASAGILETDAPVSTPPAEGTPAPTIPVSPTAMPAITPPAASAPPSSSSDITLFPVDPPADIQLD